jgi:hypothetical protein
VTLKEKQMLEPAGTSLTKPNCITPVVGDHCNEDSRNSEPSPPSHPSVILKDPAAGEHVPVRPVMVMKTLQPLPSHMGTLVDRETAMVFWQHGVAELCETWNDVN